MSQIEQESNALIKRRQAAEGRELGAETKESKEKKEEKELVAKEKIELTAVEVKNTKQRMKNIIVNMQQVLAAVRQIRQQLGLNDDNDIPAVKKDEKTLELLRKKLKGLEDQIEDLKKAFQIEEITRLRQIDPSLSQDELNRRSEEVMKNFLRDLGLEN